MAHFVEIVFVLALAIAATLALPLAGGQWDKASELERAINALTDSIISMNHNGNFKSVIDAFNDDPASLDGLLH